MLWPEENSPRCPPISKYCWLSKKLEILPKVSSILYCRLILKGRSYLMNRRSWKGASNLMLHSVSTRFTNDLKKSRPAKLNLRQLSFLVGWDSLLICLAGQLALSLEVGECEWL
jgi:hypothetical protein